VRERKRQRDALGEKPSVSTTTARQGAKERERETHVLLDRDLALEPAEEVDPDLALVLVAALELHALLARLGTCATSSTERVSSHFCTR